MKFIDINSVYEFIKFLCFYKLYDRLNSILIRSKRYELSTEEYINILKITYPYRRDIKHWGKLLNHLKKIDLKSYDKLLFDLTQKDK